MDTHATLTTGIHGVGASTIESIAGAQAKVDARVSGGTPASATAPGTVGEVRWDATFIYVCISANTWRRVGITAW